MRWPNISVADLLYSEFADFLQGCAEAIPHVQGLSILSDCEENHKLLKKLPECIVQGGAKSLWVIWTNLKVILILHA